MLSRETSNVLSTHKMCTQENENKATKEEKILSKDIYDKELLFKIYENS